MWLSQNFIYKSGQWAKIWHASCSPPASFSFKASKTLVKKKNFEMRENAQGMKEISTVTGSIYKRI